MKLEGIIPAVVTPMTRDLKPDLRALKGYIKWITGFEGLGGVAVNMDTGEGPHLWPEEKVRVLEVWANEVKGKIPILAGLSARFTQEACIQALEAGKAGADGLVVFPIPAFQSRPLEPEVPVEYHKAIIHAAGLPIVLFQLQPALGGTIFEPATLDKLLALDGVAALKEASFDALIYSRTLKQVKASKRKVAMLTGNDNFIFESFVLGCLGALIGFGTLAVGEQIAMARAVLEGDAAKGRKLADIFEPLADAVFAPPVGRYRARTKWALKRMGVIPNDYIRPPLMPTTPREQKLIEKALKPWL